MLGIVLLRSFQTTHPSSKPRPLAHDFRRCGHCVRFAPTYEQVAAQLHAKSAEAGAKRKVSAKGVAKVDGAAERALSSCFGVHGFPTFYLIDGWTVREFDGDRSLDNLVNFSLKDYEETEPIPFLFGPFGPMGQTRSLLMRSGTWAIGLYENPTKERGMKPLMAMAVLCVGGADGGVGVHRGRGHLVLAEGEARLILIEML